MQAIKEPSPDPQAPRRWLKRAPLAILGALLSATLTATAFFRVRFSPGLHLTPRFPFALWITQLPAHAHWVAVFALLTVSLVPLRALQWRFTLAEPAPAFRRRYHAVAIGAFFHNAVPGKLGEFFRAFFLARRARIPFFQSLASVLVCKLLELAALVTVVGLALAGPGSRFAPRLSVALAAATGLFAALAALAFAGARRALPVSLRLQPRLPRVAAALAQLGCGLASMRSPRRFGLAFLASFGPVLASTIAYGVALAAIGVPRGIFAGGVVLGAVSLGQLTPGLPIGTGMYYLTASWAARSLGAPPAEAAAFAALTHLASVVPQLAVGLVSLAAHRLRPKDLLEARARDAARAPATEVESASA